MNKNSNNTSSFAKKRKFKHGSYAIALTVAFVVVVILLNIGATVIANKVSLAVDLTPNKDFSVSEENKEYIKKVERDVNIVVCCDRETYISSYYTYVLGSGYYDYTYLMSSGQSTELPDYFNQNAKLLEEYAKLNSNITVEFADPQKPEFSKYTSKYSDLKTGDIIVEAAFSLNGETVSHHKILDTEDIFSIDSETYGYPIITASRIETAVTSAVYAVTSDTSFKVVHITANGGQPIKNLQNMMEMNNYEFTEVKNLIGYELPDDADLVIISAPDKDYAEEELKILDGYLHIDDDDSRALMYIGGNSNNDLPNLNEFISEWGFDILPNNVAIETDTSNYKGMPYNLVYKMASENGYTDKLAEKNYTYIASYNNVVQLKTVQNRTTTALFEIADSAVALPYDANEDWQPENAEVKGPFVGVGVTTLSQYDDNNDLHTATFMMVNSIDFITTMYNSYSDVGNIDALMTAIDKIVGREDVGISFDTRTFETTTFTAPDESSVIIMRIIFIGVIPLAVLAFGIVVWVRRRRS